jgi:hypothetical protein
MSSKAFYEYVRDGGSCTFPSAITYGPHVILLNNNNVTIDNIVYLLQNPVITTRDFRYNYGGIVGPQNIKAKYYTFPIKNGLSFVMLQHRFNEDYKFNHIELNGKNYKTK